MKKKLIILTLFLTACLVITGCGKSKNKDNSEPDNDVIDGGWETVVASKSFGLSEEEISLFNNAKKEYTGMELEPIVILARQIVAGKNYMFLAKGTPTTKDAKPSYKIVYVYYDLNGASSITKVVDFDYSKTKNKKKTVAEEMVGGWEVEAPGKLNVLEDEKLESAWEKATETLAGMTFNPIAVIAKQVVAGNNYAILCFARASYEGAADSIYVVTLYVDLEGNAEITTSEPVDIEVFYG